MTLLLRILVASSIPIAESKLVPEVSNMANKGRVLVTGATGFVALHCIAELLKTDTKLLGLCEPSHE